MVMSSSELNLKTTFNPQIRNISLTTVPYSGLQYSLHLHTDGHIRLAFRIALQNCIGWTIQQVQRSYTNTYGQKSFRPYLTNSTSLSTESAREIGTNYVKAAIVWFERSSKSFCTPPLPQETRVNTHTLQSFGKRLRQTPNLSSPPHPKTTSGRNSAKHTAQPFYVFRI